MYVDVGCVLVDVRLDAYMWRAWMWVGGMGGMEACGCGCVGRWCLGVVCWCGRGGTSNERLEGQKWQPGNSTAFLVNLSLQKLWLWLILRAISGASIWLPPLLIEMKTHSSGCKAPLGMPPHPPPPFSALWDFNLLQHLSRGAQHGI